MENLKVVSNMFDTNIIGSVIIVTMLVVCIIGCALVVYDTGRDTIKSVRELIQDRKNKKIKK